MPPCDREAALLLALGAAHVSVVEYLPTDVEHPNVTCVSWRGGRGLSPPGFHPATTPPPPPPLFPFCSGVSADGWVPAPGEFDIIVSMSR